MNYRIVDIEQYYRRGVFRHFTQDCKCSTSITHRVDVTDLLAWSRKTGTKFYINFLYVLAKVLNSREDYRLAWRYDAQQLIAYDQINPTQYIFHEDTETFTIVYTTYDPDYHTFYQRALQDMEKAKETREYGLDAANHPNWFDTSCIPWISYDSLTIELPDGYLYFNPIINWGRYCEENGKMMMPVSVRMNHAVADGYLVARVFVLMEQEMKALCEG